MGGGMDVKAKLMICKRFYFILIYFLLGLSACKPKNKHQIDNGNIQNYTAAAGNSFLPNHREKYGKPYIYNLNNMRSVIYISENQSGLNLSNAKALIENLDILKNLDKLKKVSLVDELKLKKNKNEYKDLLKDDFKLRIFKKDDTIITIKNTLHNKDYSYKDTLKNKKQPELKEVLNKLFIGDEITIRHNKTNKKLLKELGISKDSLEFDVIVNKYKPISKGVGVSKEIVIKRKLISNFNIGAEKKLDKLSKRIRSISPGKKMALVFDSNTVETLALSKKLGADFEIVPYKGKGPENKDIFIVSKNKYPTEEKLRNKANSFFKDNWNNRFCGLDGCFAKANALVQKFSDDNIPMEKIFILNPPEKYGWRYHVAAVASYKNSNGKVDQLVLDPMLGKAKDKLSNWMGDTNPEELIGADYLKNNSLDEFSITVDGMVKIKLPKEFSLQNIIKNNENGTSTIIFKREVNFNDKLFIKDNLDTAYKVNLDALERRVNTDPGNFPNPNPKSYFSNPNLMLVDPK